eukprot:1097702-Pleurochrysis_carterae.AAC.24
MSRNYKDCAELKAINVRECMIVVSLWMWTDTCLMSWPFSHGFHVEVLLDYDGNASTQTWMKLRAYWRWNLCGEFLRPDADGFCSDELRCRRLQLGAQLLNQTCVGPRIN